MHLPSATEAVKPLHQQLRIWREQSLAYLKEGPAYLHEDFPPSLSPRRQDMVEPLLQIADISGGEWPERIREALVAVFEEQAKFDLQANIQLLADIQDCFAFHGNPGRLSTADLLAWMPTLPTRPWDIDGHFSAHTLARLLAPFGIRPRYQRMSKANAEAKTKPKRGYQLEDFKEPWKQHLAPTSCPGEDPCSRESKDPDAPSAELAARSQQLEAQTSEIANNHGVCSTVSPVRTTSISVHPDNGFSAPVHAQENNQQGTNSFVSNGEVVDRASAPEVGHSFSRASPLSPPSPPTQLLLMSEKRTCLLPTSQSPTSLAFFV